MGEYVEALGMPAVDVQELLARVDLLSETILLTRYEKGMPISSYEIAPGSLAAAFSGVPMATGLLPKECLFYARDGVDQRVGVFLPPRTRTMTVVGMGDEPVAMHVPLPPLVLAGSGASYAVYAVKRRPGQDDRLYHAPLPNVYSDGRVCKGSGEFPLCAPGTIYKAVDALFESAFNFHLVNRKSKSHPDDVIALWKELEAAEAKRWPLEDLEPTDLVMNDLVGREWRWKRR